MEGKNAETTSLQNGIEEVSLPKKNAIQEEQVSSPPKENGTQEELVSSPKKNGTEEEQASSPPKKNGNEEEQVSSPKKVQKGPSRRCRHWARGLCKLGDSCTFLHSGVAGVHVPCRHFVRTGSCSRGDLCDFKHEGNYGYGVGLYGGMSPRMAVMSPKRAGCPDPVICLDAFGAGGGAFTLGFTGKPGNMRPAAYSPIYASAPAHLLPQSAIQHLSAQAAANLSVANAASMSAAASMNAANFALSIHMPQLGVPQQAMRVDGLVTTPSPPATTSTSRCRHWENGSCRLGKSCGFLHDPIVPQKFRTKVCRHWEKGNCRLGEACSFAHSANP